jgi:hypothetical protein
MILQNRLLQIAPFELPPINHLPCCACSAHELIRLTDHCLKCRECGYRQALGEDGKTTSWLNWLATRGRRDQRRRESHRAPGHTLTRR